MTGRRVGPSHRPVPTIRRAGILAAIAAAEHVDKLREAIVNAKEGLVPDIERAIAHLAQRLK